MNEEKKILKSEDQIKNIYEKITQIESYLNIITCATENDFEIPNIEDIRKTLIIASSFINVLEQDVIDYMDYLQSNNLYD